MSDEKKTQEPYNPYDDANFAKGGGLWDGKDVTITSVKATFDKFTNADGTPYLNEKGEQPTVAVLAITGIADDDEEERRQTYSVGGLVPTPDSDGFVKKDGTPGTFHENSKASRFFKGIKAGGFPLEKLLVGGKPTLQGLVGARFHFIGVDKKDKDGNAKKSKKGYVQQDFFPTKFLGYSNTPLQAAAQASNPVVVSAAKDEAQGIVIALLADNGGKLTRSQMLRFVAGKVVGKPNANAVLGVIAKPEFHNGAPWKYDEATSTLSLA